MKKLKGGKYVLGGILLLGVFVFFMTHTARAFQPKARGQDNIRLFRGRSNYSGTFNGDIPFRYLAGNKDQQNLQNAGTNLMRRS